MLNMMDGRVEECATAGTSSGGANTVVGESASGPRFESAKLNRDCTAVNLQQYSVKSELVFVCDKGQ